MPNTAAHREAAEEYDLGPMLQEQVLPEFDAGFKHANALTVSQQDGVTVSQPEPVAGVVANDRAESGCRNHYPNVEVRLRRGINGSENENRFARQGQSHTFQPHDERHRPIAVRAHQLLQFSKQERTHKALQTDVASLWPLANLELIISLRTSRMTLCAGFLTPS